MFLIENNSTDENWEEIRDIKTDEFFNTRFEWVQRSGCYYQYIGWTPRKEFEEIAKLKNKTILKINNSHNKIEYFYFMDDNGLWFILSSNLLITSSKLF